MIYFIKPEGEFERYDINFFFAKEKNWKSYLILIIAKPGEEILLARQITRQRLDGLNWLIASYPDFGSLFIQDFRKDDFWKLIIAEITFTGNKDNTLFGHNWELMMINHRPKNKPFDKSFADCINRVIDQTIFNYDEESAVFRKKLDLMFIDLIKSGMFKMQPDPIKVMGD
jgi:hypothetical protein